MPFSASGPMGWVPDEELADARSDEIAEHRLALRHKHHLQPWMLTLLDPLVEYVEPDDVGLLGSHLLSRVLREHRQMSGVAEAMRASPEAITAADRCAEIVMSHDPELGRSLKTVLQSAGQLLDYRDPAAEWYDPAPTADDSQR